MRDVKLFYDNGFDIDVDSEGFPVLMDTEDQTYDQRAAVACAIEKGTIPSAEDIGVDWGAVYGPDYETSLSDINRQCNEMIQACAARDDGGSYVPIFLPDADGRVVVQTMRSGV